MNNWTSEEFAEIGKRSRIIAGQENRRCNIRERGIATGCWCLHAGENGSHAACPPPWGWEPQSTNVPEQEEFHFPGLTDVPWHPPHAA